MKRATSYLLISLHALIVVFFVFHERLGFPPFLQSFGRVHPLFLHLPIGVLLITVVFVFFRQTPATTSLIDFLLAFTAVAAALTALMGIILGAEGGYDEQMLGAHRISGVLMSLVAWGTWFAYNSVTAKPNLHKGLVALSFVVLLITGHLGSVITHGDQFVLGPILRSRGVERMPISDSTSLFRAAVFPILEEKCMSCHNGVKKKGGLSFSSGASLMKGGEHGKPWIPGEPRKSLLVSRILLPEGHEDHMPPDGKPQLNLAEINLVFSWIQSGADTALAWSAFSKQDTVRRLAEMLMATQSDDSKQVYHFDEPDEKAVEELNDAYRTVGRIALSEPALSATMFISSQYTPDRLKDLLKVRGQLVDLNLSGMPVSDADCKVIAEFGNLEKLNLNFSSITGHGITALSSLEKLRSLAVAGTSLDDDALLALKDFPALKEVFIWNTEVKEPAKLAVVLKGVTVQTGAILDENEVLRLSSPLLVNESLVLEAGDSIWLSHKLPGTIMRFTLDGSEPDTVESPVFQEALAISKCTELKVVACKPGWYCSQSARFVFFRKGEPPSKVTLNTPTDKDYRGQGATTLHDNKKGFADNVRGDIAWLGFRENSMDASFTFETAPVVNEIVISYAKNIPSFLFPPAEVEVWAADDAAKLKLVRSVTTVLEKESGRTRIEALTIPLNGARYRHYRIVVRPVPQLPAWHSANNKDTKDKRGWVFVDEIFFN